MNLEVIIPALMGAALLWWIGRDMSMTARLATMAVTLGLIAVIVLFERSSP